MGARAAVGLIGSVCIIVGVFSPIVYLFGAGQQTYFQTKSEECWTVLAAGCAGALLSVTGRVGLLPVVGLIAGGIAWWSRSNLAEALAAMKKDAATELAGNPFRSLAESMIDQSRLEWGWSLMFIGAIALIIAPLMPQTRPTVVTKPSPPPPPPESPGFPVIVLSPGRYAVRGVDRESGMDTLWYCHAENPDNARAKGEREGIIVTRVEAVTP